MKRALIALALVAGSALAAVTLTNTEDRGWQAIRGTTNVGTPHATEAACREIVRADAEARRASANYRCVLTKSFRAQWVATPPVVVPPLVTDPHNGGHHAGNMPHYNPATIPTPAAGFSDYRIQAGNERPTAGDGTGAFRTVCTRSHFNRDDSLVYPGQVGRAHLHMYFGNTGSNANSTPESLRGSGNSTCRGGIANRSTYWVPAVIDTTDGAVIDMREADVYYKTGYGGVRPQDVQPIPPGLRMIAGDMTRTTIHPFGGGFEFRCGGRTQNGIPANCTSGEAEIEINFPQCWDGKRLYAADQSHMAQSNNGCPATHPVALPSITYIMKFPIAQGRNTSNWRLSSDNYVGGQGGFSMHADWINGWDPALPPVWTTRILNPALDGGSHMIGDGRSMY